MASGRQTVLGRRAPWGRGWAPRDRRAAVRAALLVAGALAAFPAFGLGASAASYKLRKGDHLTGVAKAFGVTVGDLRQANGLRDATLQPGQRLAIADPLRLVTPTKLRWRRPLAGRPGRVLRAFNPRPAGRDRRGPHTGVDLSAALGASVICPANGVVRYCGLQDGFGTVVILEHGAGYSTVLAPVVPDTALCRVGEAVRRGDLLGKIAEPVESEHPYLHVELRRDLKPVSPLRLLR